MPYSIIPVILNVVKYPFNHCRMVWQILHCLPREIGFFISLGRVGMTGFFGHGRHLGRPLHWFTEGFKWPTHRSATTLTITPFQYQWPQAIKRLSQSLVSSLLSLVSVSHIVNYQLSTVNYLSTSLSITFPEHVIGSTINCFDNCQLKPSQIV